MTREFTAFVLAGVVAAAVNWVSRFGFSLFMPLELAVIPAYLLGMATAFTLNRRYVFAQTDRSVQSQVLRFTFVNLIALIQVWVVSVVMARFLLPFIGWTFYAEAVAHAAGVASPILTSYLGHRNFTFSPSQAKPATNSTQDR